PDQSAGAAHLGGASLSQRRPPLERGTERHPAGERDGPRAGHAGGVRRRDVHGTGRLATDQPHHARTRSDIAATPTQPTRPLRERPCAPSDGRSFATGAWPVTSGGASEWRDTVLFAGGALHIV